MNKKALIFVPTGTTFNYDNRYDMSAHWRSTRPERTYEILSAMYDDSVPDPSTYDYLAKVKDHKWQMVRKIFKDIDIDRYDYIGCIDDDEVTDVWNLNRGLELARRFDFRLWQLSMAPGSQIWYDCLKQDTSIDFSETNFLECGVPVFRTDIFKKILAVLDEWKDFEQGWGMDKVYCDIAQSNAHVIHCASVYHPPRSGYYDKSHAMQELHDFTNTIYPRIIKKLYNRDSLFVDQQSTYRKYKLR